VFAQLGAGPASDDASTESRAFEHIDASEALGQRPERESMAERLGTSSGDLDSEAVKVLVEEIGSVPRRNVNPGIQLAPPAHGAERQLDRPVEAP
jgi:hypothetical protein